VMAVLVPPPTEIDDGEARALFEEARRRRRRRRLRVAAVALLALVATAGALFAVATSRPSAPKQPTARPTPRSAARATAGVVTPEHPYAMAVAANGTLYLVDAGRDQILRRSANGHFQVVAGDGQLGFSGDGGPATEARISVSMSSGIAVADNGAVFFADTGNQRVREITPNGVMETVAGGGTVPMGLAPEPADQVALSDVTGLAMGPGGDLYMAATAVYRLDDAGQLQWVVGQNTPPPPGWQGVYANPAVQSDFFGATRLAFDGSGDLFVAGGGGWGLYEQTDAGAMRFIENFRGDGFWGSLAPAPDGSVVLASRSGLARFEASGTIASIPHQSLSAALDSDRAKSSNLFIGGDGVAVAPNGTIDVDTNTGNAFTSVTAILAVSPNGKVRTLWSS
jgi:hypothetical protein